MCTAYEIGKTGIRLPDRADASVADFIRNLDGLRIVRPTLKAPVMMPDGSLREMSWGFRRQFEGKTPGKVITRTIVNSREDKLSTMTWREAFRQRRCLIPAAGFYEWTEGSGGVAVPLRFERTDGEMLWIAGIWEEAENGPCYSMITTEPNGLVHPVHDRMPAVLLDEQIDPFLDFEINDLGPSSVSLQYSAVANFLRAAPLKNGKNDLKIHKVNFSKMFK